jgi:uncharacterized protein
LPEKASVFLTFAFFVFPEHAMNLTEQINQDMKSAMKAGEKLRLATLRTIRAAILEFEKEKVGNVMTDEDALRILSAAAKRRREAIEQYSAAGREDLASTETLELEIITAYLPAQLSDEELEAIVRETIVKSEAKDMKDFGRVMGPLSKELKGRADGAKIQALVRAHLGGQ